jgi:hypothetical protein
MKPLPQNRINPVFLKILLLSLVLFIEGGIVHAATWYVKPVASGTGNGSSWVNAAGGAQLAAIITGAASGDMVWVVGTAAGAVYYPTTGTSRAAAFTLKSGVTVYGGFAGTETVLGQQNPAVYVSILSGDIGVVGNNTDNCYNVVVSLNATGVVLSGFTITGGNANGTGQNSTGGGIYNSDGATSNTLTFISCVVSNNTAIGDGGGVYNTGGGIAFISCTVSNNTSSAEGGGMYTYGSGNGDYTLTSCTFSNNTASGNGGGYCVDNGSLPVTFTNDHFSNNRTTNTAYDGGGGGVYVTNGSITMTGCSFNGNSSSAYGGGMIINQGSNQPISNCTFTSNTAALFGGGMACVQGSAPIVSSCNFSSNAALEGGGIYNISGSPSFKYDTLFGNTATGSSGTGGGGMCSDTSANPVVSHCWFNANVTSGGNGAGLYEQSSAGNDSNCVFQANVAKGTASNGGGLYHLNGTSKVWNSVFLNNSCTGGYGGGIYNNTANSTYEHLTLYNNYSTASTSATPFGDGIYVAGGNPKIYNDIVWTTTSASVGVLYVATITSYKVQYSDVQNGSLFLTGTGNVTSAPGFAAAGSPLGADNIWATADDGFHLVSSAAAKAVTPGNFLADDITDFARPATAPNADMGAYEGGGNFITLAVQLLNFTATAAGGNMVDVDWKVGATGQASQFVVQRSVTGTNFVSIGSEGVLSGQTAYRFVDPQANGETIYYRLQMVMADGSEAYSAVAIVRNGLSAMRFSLRPSVATQGSTTLYIGSPRTMNISLIVVNVAGRVLSKRSLVVGQGDNYVPVELGGLPNGLYFLCVSGEGISRQTLTLEKL